jgi:hypothetical protein
MTKQSAQSEEIELLRGGSVVSTLVGAFGGAVRETRLTALLGYLIALEPSSFLEFLDLPGKARSVRIEHRHGTDRSDILIETTRGLTVVEAKIGVVDPFEQAQKYKARRTILLTQYRPTTTQRAIKGFTYVRWQQLIPLLSRFEHSKNAKARFVGRDLLAYLEEHRMVKTHDSVEIYSREINEPLTLALFLKAHMYGCDYEASSQLAEALYFAPHFGQTIANTAPGIGAGISYVARIEQVEVVETWADLERAVRSVRKGTWLNSHKTEIAPIQNGTGWDWGEGRQKYSFLFLSKPRLVFNPPINKERLQRGKGWLSKRVFTFEEFYKAWSGETLWDK